MRKSRVLVAEATEGVPLLPGRISIAPGGEQHLEVAGGASPRCRLGATPLVSGHRPSVDALFRSVAEMAGASTLGQDAASSLSYGMPKAAFEMGAVERQLPLRRIGAEIAAMTNKLNRT